MHDPIVVDAFPYAIAGTTVGAEPLVDSYECEGAAEAVGAEAEW